MLAGRSTARTIVASIRIATASPTPNCLKNSDQRVHVDAATNPTEGARRPERVRARGVQAVVLAYQTGVFDADELELRH